MPFNTIQEYISDPNTTLAERKLITACQEGKNCVLSGEGASLSAEDSKGTMPHIRVDLIRLLILGGSPTCALHPVGIWLEGAHIAGALDLRFAKTNGQCILKKCHFEKPLEFAYAEFAYLNLSGSRFPGLNASGMKSAGTVDIQRIVADGTVDLTGAEIGGSLLVSDAQFIKPLGNTTGKCFALLAGWLKVRQDILLKGVSADGTIYMHSASVDGRLVLQGSKIGCDAAGENKVVGDAFNGQNLRVAETFIFRNMRRIAGDVVLGAANIGTLVDDPESWTKTTGQIYLNGFTYNRFGGSAATALAERKNWLDRGSRFQSSSDKTTSIFTPQPYSQFAKVLRDAGHAPESRKVLIERTRLIFEENHKNNLAALESASNGDGSDVGIAWLNYHLLCIWARISFFTSGYGHAPQRALFLSLACIGVGSVWFWLAWYSGVLVPNSAVILTSSEWLAAMAANPDHPGTEWANRPPGKHYETFSSLLYAIDLFVPFFALGQDSAWAATTVSCWGQLTRCFTFVYQVTGWVITALGVAAVTGFVQKNQPD